jgi:hypothetical protein
VVIILDEAGTNSSTHRDMRRRPGNRV